MKKILCFLILIMLTGVCHGETQQEQIEKLKEKQKRCLILGSMYGSAAESKNRGFPPMMAYEALLQYIRGNEWITKDMIKTIVNKVYFDPAFINVGGSRFEHQMYDICFTGYNPYHPIK